MTFITNLQQMLWSTFDKGVKVFTVAFILFLLLSPWRFPVFLGLCIIFLINKEQQWLRCLSERLSRVFVRHTNKCALLILLLGILLRLGMFWVVKDSLSAPYDSDAGAFLQKVESLTVGIWPANKSWMTVLVYAGWGKLFSTSYLSLSICGNILQVITIILAFVIGRKLFGPVGGVIIEGYVAFDLMSIVLSNAIYLENVYYMIVLMMVFVTSKMDATSSLLKSLILAILSAIFAWCMIWTRSDGIVFLIALLLLYVFKSFCRKGDYSFLKLCVLGITSLSLAFFSFFVNIKTDDSKTIFCSNDNYIPRVMGVNYRSKGSWDSRVIKELDQRYIADNPEKREQIERNTIKQPYPYMNELVPYCKEMIHESTNSLTLWQWIELIWIKEITIFWGNLSITPNSRIITYALSMYRNSIITLLCLPIVFTLWQKTREVQFVNYLFAITAAGIMLLYVLGEVSPRYGQLLFLLLTITCASQFRITKHNLDEISK